MEKDIFIKFIYVVFSLTLIVNIYLGFDVYFELDQSIISRNYLGKFFIILNSLLLFGFIAYPIYGNKKYGNKRVKIKRLVLVWIAVFILLIFIAISFVLKGIS